MNLMIPTTPSVCNTILTLATVPPRSEIRSIHPKYDRDVEETYMSVKNVVLTMFGDEFVCS